MDVWHCHVCGALRPEGELVLTSVDRGEEIGEPPGLVYSHVRHCADRADCAARVGSLLTVGSPTFVIEPT